MAALKAACIVFLVLNAFVHVLAASTIVGGFSPADPSDPGTAKAEQAARAKVAQATGTCDAGLTTTDRQKQIVNGVNYRFNISSNPALCGTDGVQKTCNIQVYTPRNQDPAPENAICQ